ncbi:amidohydrolase [Paraeggerthella hongkongensis]|uniref:amidohydrolase n=3 Tax=Paraeggerthella sp. TaxID=2897350 RepID=UPI000DF7FA24|nr:amidohydrolase [Paraeggerthella hongkongensis]
MRIDLVIESENVFTGTSDAAKPGAIAIAQDRIVAVGSHDEVRAFVRKENEGGELPPVRAMGDALVVPGFHDSHLHFFHSAIYASPLATTFLGKNEADCVQRMVEFSKSRPKGWLLAQGWREYRWDPPVLPSKASLDEAFPSRPVALYSGDAHTLWLNSAALAELGLDRTSVPPAGGSYDRDDEGELTGIVREAAAMELMPKIMGSFTDEEVADAYRGFFARLAENGVTSVCDMSLMASPGLDFIRDDVHASLLERGELTARVHLFPTLLEDMSRFETMRATYTGPMLQAPGFKQFFDGVSSQHTAWVTEPYTNAQFEGDCGRPTVEPGLMRSYIMAAAGKGYPVRIHAIGDAAIHAALDFFEEARATYGPLPDGRRNCLEHLENFLPGDIERLADLQVVGAVQPPHITLDPGGPERDLGQERVPLMWPFRTMLDEGATLAFGTDSPVVDVNSMNVLYTAVTRQDPETHAPCGGWLPAERISMAEALRAYAQGSAAAAGRERELGTIEPGMLADVTVLDRNVLTCEEDDIQKTRVLATFVGGRCVYER